MHLLRLQIAALLGIAFPHVFSSITPSTLSDCLASVDVCFSDLRKSQEAFYSNACGDKGCQMKSFEVCNLTIPTALDQFPSLHGCVCACQEDLCASMQALATQCSRQAVNSGAGSCIDRAMVCIGDAVCNSYLAPVLQACRADQCRPGRCQQAAQRFYGSMPSNVAEMLVMCECEASDQSCMSMKSALHGSTCGEETRTCQETIHDCAEDDNCRNRLKTFQTKCWSSGEAECSDSELRKGECLADMDPTHILGADSECKAAFLATVGTPLHRPCSCKGLNGGYLLTCSKIHSVFHNRSHFAMSWKSPSKLLKASESETDHIQSKGKYSDYFLLPLASLLLFGVVILLPITLISKVWVLKRREKTNYHHPEKSNCVLMI